MVRMPSRLANSRSVRFNSTFMYAGGNVAHVRMRERVIPDQVPFVVNPLRDARKTCPPGCR